MILPPRLVLFLRDEEAAQDFIERTRWPDGIVCPHCGARRVYRLTLNRPGRKRFKCASCRRQFPVTKHSVLEDSHLPLGVWLAALFMADATPRGAMLPVGLYQKSLGVSYKTAWRLRTKLIGHGHDPLLLALTQGLIGAGTKEPGPWMPAPPLETENAPPCPLCAVPRRGQVP